MQHAKKKRGPVRLFPAVRGVMVASNGAPKRSRVVVPPKKVQAVAVKTRYFGVTLRDRFTGLKYAIWFTTFN